MPPPNPRVAFQIVSDRRRIILPLTLTYGQQPPRTTITRQMAVVTAAWPPDLEPRLTGPNNQRVSVAPLTLTYGQQPPRRTSGQAAIVVSTWPTDLEPRQNQPAKRTKVQ